MINLEGENIIMTLKEERFVKAVSLEQELSGNSYPGRGIIIGKSEDGAYAVTA